jgi:hypothetical protein
MNSSGESHIRLIWDASSQVEFNDRRSETQLDLPLYDAFHILLWDIGKVDRDSFLSVLQDFRPEWVVDVRIAPRFDRLAGGRHFAFNALENLGIRYVDLFGVLGLKTYQDVDINPSCWSRELANKVAQTHCSGPYLFLFDNRQLLDAAGVPILESFKKVISDSVSLSWREN